MNNRQFCPRTLSFTRDACGTFSFICRKLPEIDPFPDARRQLILPVANDSHLNVSENKYQIIISQSAFGVENFPCYLYRGKLLAFLSMQIKIELDKLLLLPFCFK